MADAERLNDVVVLLANDALEASQQSPAHASMLLVDAAIAILTSRHQGAAAREIAGMLSEYIMEQVGAVEAARGGAHG